MTTIAIIDDADADDERTLAVAQATDQCMREFCRDWGLPYIPVNVFGPGAVLPDSVLKVRLLTKSKNPQFAGAHSGSFFEAPNAYAVAKGISGWETVVGHECMEMALNPYVNQWREWVGHPGMVVAKEACDAVQADYFFMLVDVHGKSINVPCSNWILPSWFEENSTGPWDHMNVLTGPGQLSRGGYTLARKAGILQETQFVFGKRLMPWQRGFRKDFDARKMKAGTRAMAIKETGRG